MIVSQIRSFLRQRQRATVSEIALHVDSDANAVEGLMQTLVRRGLAMELGCGNCSGASGCSVAGPRVYTSLEASSARVDAQGACLTR